MPASSKSCVTDLVFRDRRFRAIVPETSQSASVNTDPPILARSHMDGQTLVRSDAQTFALLLNK